MPPKYEVVIRCHKCSAQGAVLWEGSGQNKMLVRMSGQFYERLSKVPPHRIELVCQQCGTLQAD